MGDLQGKTFLVTGANTGIGRTTALALARRGARIWLACRSRAKTEPVIAEIVAATGDPRSAEFLELDLGSLASVRTAAETFLRRGEPLHVLVNNAGLAGARGRTTDGFEMTFGVNHLGPFLFTMLLKARLAASAPARIVNVASKAHYRAKQIDFGDLRTPTSALRSLHFYQISKLCNVLFTSEWARRHPAKGVHAYALHPGVVASDIWRRIPWPIRPIMTAGMITNEQGAETSLYCATSPDVADHDGRYYDNCREKEPSALSKDPGLARELWEKSVEWSRSPS